MAIPAGGLPVREQGLGFVGAAQHGFGHAVVQQGRDGLQFGRFELLRRADAGAEDAALEHHREGDAALDAVDVRHAAVVGDVGGLRGPRRDRAQARDHEELLGHALVLGFRHRLAVGQHGGQAFGVAGRQAARGIDEVVEARLDTAAIVGATACSWVRRRWLRKAERALEPGRINMAWQSVDAAWLRVKDSPLLYRVDPPPPQM
jgi:hypothetical protein